VLALELQGVQEVGAAWLPDVLHTKHDRDPELKKQVYSFIQVGWGGPSAAQKSWRPVAARRDAGRWPLLQVIHEELQEQQCLQPVLDLLLQDYRSDLPVVR
jgi:hypothetical protein